MATTLAPFPTLTAQQPIESHFEFGLRGFRFLLVESAHVSAYALDLATLEQVMSSSSVLMAAPVSDRVREQYREVRAQVATAIAFLQAHAREAATVAAATPDQQTPPSRSAKLRRPVPVLPPSGATARPF